MSAALNPESPLPLYPQLADLLLERIRTGEYRSGSRIPSETALARRFRIGRPTVRQATDQLVRRRCLERRRGSGTYVVEPPERVDLCSLAGSLEIGLRQDNEELLAAEATDEIRTAESFGQDGRHPAQE